MPRTIDTKPVVVKCPDYTKRCRNIDEAEHWIASVERFGHCRHEHVIVLESVAEEAQR